MAYEIERKYLIEYPDTNWLRQQPGCQVVGIVQTYLKKDGSGNTRRVRRWTENGMVRYIKTEKKKISAIKRIEMEEEISKETYEALLQEKDITRNEIEKTRYRFYQNGFCYEVDLFPFWKDKAFLEVEIEDESVSIPLPEGITIIKEVTEDGRYTNHALAAKIPEEL